MRASVLGVSVIRLKTTFDSAAGLDLTWDWVRNGIWWLVYRVHCTQSIGYS